eukprot:Opistho-2@35836
MASSEVLPMPAGGTGDDCGACVAHLCLFSPPRTVENGSPDVIHLRDGVPIIVGRDRTTADVVFDSTRHPRMMSRTHATLTASKTRFGTLSIHIIDHASVNGVFVNQERIISRRQLNLNDTVSFGCGHLGRGLGFIYRVEYVLPAMTVAVPVGMTQGANLALDSVEEPRRLDQQPVEVPPVLAEVGSVAAVDSLLTDGNAHVHTGVHASEAPAAASQRRPRDESTSPLRSVRPRLVDLTASPSAAASEGGPSDSAERSPEAPFTVISLIGSDSGEGDNADFGSPAASGVSGLPTSDALCSQVHKSLGLEEEFTCVVCQDLMVKAVTLTCSHSFCGSCVDNWLSMGHRDCPMCRSPVTGKSPSRVIDNAIQRILASLSEEEKSRFEQRLRDLQASEDEALRQLKGLAELAKEKNKSFLDVSQQWSPKDRSVFAKGLRRYRGEARRFWCELTNLTPAFIASASQQQLAQAARNIGIQAASSSMVDLRKGLIAFIQNSGAADV